MKQFLLVLITLISLSITAQDRKSCKGITTKGIACKSVMVMTDGYCRAHSPNTIRCGAVTSTGKSCKMPVKQSGDRCRFHKGK